MPLSGVHVNARPLLHPENLFGLFLIFKLSWWTFRTFFFRFGGGEGVVRGARKEAGVGFLLKTPRRWRGVSQEVEGGFPGEGGGGLRAWRVSVGNLGGGVNFLFWGPKIPTKPCKVILTLQSLNNLRNVDFVLVLKDILGGSLRITLQNKTSPQG